MTRSFYIISVNFFLGLVFGLLLSSFVRNFYEWSTGWYLTPTGQLYPRTISLNASLESGIQGYQSLFPDIQRGILSHQDQNQQPRRHSLIDFNDKNQHHDDDTLARKLYNKTRILVWVMTSPQNLQKKAKHVKATWAKRFNKVLFVSDSEDKTFPTIAIKVKHGREHLTQKTMAAFDYVHKYHLADADWFMKADDDTYVIAENLRYLLSDLSPDLPVYYGQHFKPLVKQGYHSGGGGYVISKEALRRFARRKAGQCPEDLGAEDVQFGRCMERLGVKPGDSRDSLGKSRFHCFSPENHIHGAYPAWYYQYDKFSALKGPDNISDYAISFHYVLPKQMYSLEFYIYHLRPYGIHVGEQDINKPNSVFN